MDRHHRERARERLAEAAGEVVVGHSDWSVKNFAFSGDRVAAVYDWDSLAIDFEPVFVGEAVHAFPATWYIETAVAPTPEEAAAFVREYESARGRPFTAAEMETVRAAADYAMAYSARCAHSDDPEGAFIGPGTTRGSPGAPRPGAAVTCGAVACQATPWSSARVAWAASSPRAWEQRRTAAAPRCRSTACSSSASRPPTQPSPTPAGRSRRGSGPRPRSSISPARPACTRSTPRRARGPASTRRQPCRPYRGPDQLRGGLRRGHRRLEFGSGVARDLGLQPFPLADEMKVTYHAAMVFAGNYLSPSPGNRRPARAPRGSTATWRCACSARSSTARSRWRGNPTGPINRGDAETIAAHLEAIGPELAPLDPVRSGGPPCRSSIPRRPPPFATSVTTGLVPTMGAFHDGHRSLVRGPALRTGASSCTLFVNPTQFAPGEDLESYPRDEATDAAHRRPRRASTSLFAPSVEEMYPDGFSTTVHVAGITGSARGPRRPGHFDGVATVVLKLFNRLRPDVAYFGQKDAQQLAVIRRMARRPRPRRRDPGGRDGTRARRPRALLAKCLSVS